MSKTYTRREILRAAAALPMVTWVPGVRAASDPASRVLLLVELAGGNDSLNTLIPFAAPAYYRLRPALAVPRDQVLPLSRGTGLHPAMESLMPAWRAGDVAACLGVGHPDLSQSHHRSRRVWEMAGGRGQQLGWIARTLGCEAGENTATGGMKTIHAVAGPLRGGSHLRAAGGDVVSLGTAATCRCDDIEPIDRWADVTAEIVELAHAGCGQNDKQATSIPAALSHAGQVIASNDGVTAIKVRQSGFDTHENQRDRHASLLAELARGLSDLRTSLIRSGHWNRVLVMTYSEFGRTIRENAAAGTDHGTVGSTLLLGGRINPGLFGQQPSLGGHQHHAIDLRQIQATIARRWWGRQADPAFPSIDFLA